MRLQEFERDSIHVSDVDLNELDESIELSRTIRQLIMRIESKIQVFERDVEFFSERNEGFLAMACS